MLRALQRPQHHIAATAGPAPGAGPRGTGGAAGLAGLAGLAGPVFLCSCGRRDMADPADAAAGDEDR